MACFDIVGWAWRPDPPDPCIRSHKHPSFVHQPFVYDPIAERRPARLPDFALKFEET